jgi:hypothetical protein
VDKQSVKIANIWQRLVEREESPKGFSTNGALQISVPRS